MSETQCKTSVSLNKVHQQNPNAVRSTLLLQLNSINSYFHNVKNIQPEMSRIISIIVVNRKLRETDATLHALAGNRKRRNKTKEKQVKSRFADAFVLAELFSRYSFYTLEARTSFRVITESHLLPAITSAADYVTIITTIDCHFTEVTDGY